MGREKKGFAKYNKGAESTWQQMKRYWTYSFNFRSFLLPVTTEGPDYTLRLQTSYTVIIAISPKYLALPSINALLKLVSVLIKYFLERKC